MNFNICIVQPQGYLHSAAFTELAEVVGYGLQDLGHEVTLEVNQVFPDAVNIVIGCHLLDPIHIKQLPKTTIVLNTEQISHDQTRWISNIFEWVQNFTTWDYSERNIEKLRSVGAKNPKHLKLGFHKKLARIEKRSVQDIDVLFYGSMNDRRIFVVEEIKKLGVNIKAVFGVYGEQRDNLISRAKIVLNMHHYQSKIFEIVRVFYLMTNSKAIISDVEPSTSINDAYRSAILASPYTGLARATQALLEDEEHRVLLERASYDAIVALPQSELIRPLLLQL